MSPQIRVFHRSASHKPERPLPRISRMLAVPGMAAASTLIAVAGCGSGAAAPAATATAPAATATASPPLSDCLTLAHPTCYAPRQFRVAYGIQPLLDHGINGRGQTIVLPEIAPAATATVTDVRQDLARYDSLFGLPAARLQVLTHFAGAASPYQASGEEAGDAEIAHAIAPGAAIRVILLPATLAQSGTAAIASAYAAALRLAPSFGAVVSVSAGLGERCLTSADIAAVHSALLEDQDRRVTVIVSSGDFGAAVQPCPSTAASAVPPKGVNYPAADPLVLAVGGTSLNADHKTGAYLSETAWNRPITPAQGPHWASGGGFSGVFPRPAYQAGIAGIGASRGVPDVAADADAYTGIAGVGVLSSGQYVISQSTGTSAARRSGLGSSPWPTSTPAGTWASSTPVSTASARAPHTTRRFTTSPRETTRSCSGSRPSPDTRPHLAGIRSPAGAAPTRRPSFRCSPTTSAPDPCCARSTRVAEPAKLAVPEAGGETPAADGRVSGPARSSAGHRPGAWAAYAPGCRR